MGSSSLVKIVKWLLYTDFIHVISQLTYTSIFYKNREDFCAQGIAQSAAATDMWQLLFGLLVAFSGISNGYASNMNAGTLTGNNGYDSNTDETKEMRYADF